jgi:hypothetical protein
MAGLQAGGAHFCIRNEESAMSSQYNASSRPVRSAIAMLACVATVTVLASIGGLAEHYSDQG